jgi:hypothetical protein
MSFYFFKNKIFKNGEDSEIILDINKSPILGSPSRRRCSSTNSQFFVKNFKNL